MSLKKFFSKNKKHDDGKLVSSSCSSGFRIRGSWESLRNLLSLFPLVQLQASIYGAFPLQMCSRHCQADFVLQWQWLPPPPASSMRINWFCRADSLINIQFQLLYPRNLALVFDVYIRQTPGFFRGVVAQWSNSRSKCKQMTALTLVLWHTDDFFCEMIPDFWAISVHRIALSEHRNTLQL